MGTSPTSPPSSAVNNNVLPPLPMVSALASPQGSPQFSQSIDSVELADPRATRALIALMDMHATIGGAASHFGGPAAFAELMSATHAKMFADAREQRQPWTELYNFVNDAGHCENGLYALRANYGIADMKLSELEQFRALPSRLTGHGESHLFPEAVLLSNGPLGSAFPQSQGLAMADALAGRPRVTICAISDGACMEGEAREAFAAIPGLAKKGMLAPYVLVLSDNNTKLSGRIDEESFSMEPTFSALASLGWKILKEPKGNDLASCWGSINAAIAMAKQDPKTPVLLHAHTVKGFGHAKSMKSSSGGHGFALKSSKELPEFLREIYGSEAVPHPWMEWAEKLVKLEESAKTKPLAGVPTRRKIDSTQPSEKIQKGVASALIASAEKGLPVVSITSDLPGSTGVAEFRARFPKMSFDIGVAESNMISVAAGFSKSGFIPVVDTFAQFGVTKGALPLTMAALSQAPMIGIFSHTGFQDAADGASHQALNYYAMTAGIPHLEVIALTSSSEAHDLVAQAVTRFADCRKQGQVPPTTLFFLGRENFPRAYHGAGPAQLGRAQVVFDNTRAVGSSHHKSVTLIAAGSLLVEALAAAETLEGQGVNAIVVNPSQLNHVDLATVLPCIEKTQGRYLCAEDHQAWGGFGQDWVATIEVARSSGRMQFVGVKGEFGQSAYVAQDLYAKHGLDASSLVRAVRRIFES